MNMHTFYVLCEMVRDIGDSTGTRYISSEEIIGGLTGTRYM